MIELVYDPAERKTALVVARDGQWSVAPEFKTAAGEILVPYSADNNLIRHDCVVLASRPDPGGSKTELLRDVAAYLHRYVDLSPLFEQLAAHYVLLSWVYDAFNELPYLRLKGDFGSGKTRALIAIGSITYKGFFASGASTVSPIFRMLDTFGGTLILDEADLRDSSKRSELVKILNNGTVKGLPVLRTLQTASKEFNPAAFTVFGPKIVAMRGRFQDEALESRFLTEEMGARPLRSDIPIALPDGLRLEALALRNRLLAFRLTNRFAVASTAASVVPDVDPRLNQMALSLSSLIDDEDLQASFRADLKRRHAEIAVRRGADIERLTLDVLTKAFSESPRPFISLRELAMKVSEGRGVREGAVSTRAIGRILRDRAIPLRKTNGDVVADLHIYRRDGLRALS